MDPEEANGNICCQQSRVSPQNIATGSDTKNPWFMRRDPENSRSCADVSAEIRDGKFSSGRSLVGLFAGGTSSVCDSLKVGFVERQNQVSTWLGPKWSIGELREPWARTNVARNSWPKLDVFQPRSVVYSPLCASASLLAHSDPLAACLRGVAVAVSFWKTP